MLFRKKCLRLYEKKEKYFEKNKKFPYKEKNIKNGIRFIINSQGQYELREGVSVKSVCL